MRKEFIELSERAKEFSRDMERLMDKMSVEDVKQLDNSALCNELETCRDALDSFVEMQNYFSKDYEIGVLELKENGRYSLCDGYGGTHEFCCGYTLELELYDEYDERYKWYFGTVEHSTSLGYYFYSDSLDEKLALKNGMRGRIRW